MNLEKFRSRIQKRLTVMMILVGAFVALCLIAGNMGTHPSASMLMGMGTGGGLMALVVVIQQSKTLKDEKKLRQLYIQEYDERMIAIRQKAGYPMVIILSVGVAAAAVVAGCFNEVVMETLLTVAVVQLLVSLGLKIWYTKTM